MTFLMSSTGKISLAWGQKWHMPPKFISEWNLEVFLLPLDGMLVHRRVYSHPGFKFAGTIYKTPGDERGMARVKRLALTGARTQTAES